MSSKNYKVYFNAVSTEHGNHLFAVGWTTSAGFQAVLEREGESSDFVFDVKKTGDVAAQVITPFQLAERIPDDPRSVFVKIADKKYQVQVNGLKGGEAGSNTSGKWVEIKVNE
jgi:hypothetical protein